MGLLNPKKAFTLFYQGKSSGGVNLPFDTISECVAHAKLMSATSFRIENTETGETIAASSRPDCRHAFKHDTHSRKGA